jgi:hypothetical protein
MASTRNKNTPGNYCLQQKQFSDSSKWSLYEYGACGQAYNTRLAGNGLNPGQLPWNTLSNNAADTESFLFGINSTNLVNPAPCFTPEIKCLKTANVFKMPDVIMPVPLVVPKDQRPFPIP